MVLPLTSLCVPRTVADAVREMIPKLATTGTLTMLPRMILPDISVARLDGPTEIPRPAPPEQMIVLPSTMLLLIGPEVVRRVIEITVPLASDTPLMVLWETTQPLALRRLIPVTSCSASVVSVYIVLPSTTWKSPVAATGTRQREKLLPLMRVPRALLR